MLFCAYLYLCFIFVLLNFIELTLYIFITAFVADIVFEKDENALESILNNVGVTDQLLQKNDLQKVIVSCSDLLLKKIFFCLKQLNKYSGTIQYGFKQHIFVFGWKTITLSSCSITTSKAFSV